MPGIGQAGIGTTRIGSTNVFTSSVTESVGKTEPAALDATIDIATKGIGGRAIPQRLSPVALEPDNVETFYDEATSNFYTEWFEKTSPDGGVRAISVIARFREHLDTKPVEVIVQRDDTGDGTVDAEGGGFVIDPDSGIGVLTEADVGMELLDNSHYRIRFPNYNQTNAVAHIHAGIIRDARAAMLDAWPYDFGTRVDGFTEYLNTYATEVNRIQTFRDELFQQHFVDGATREELEKLGSETGVERDFLERDTKYRYRISVKRAAASSTGTADDIRFVMKTAFGEEALDAINVSHTSGEPITDFEVPQSEIDDIPLTVTELESVVETAFPVGHGATITTT